MKDIYTHAGTLFVLIFTLSCQKSADIKQSLDSITEMDMKERISVLASDEFQGRFPATVGEEKTVKYLSDQFREIGLIPGNGNSYYQEVPLVKITPDHEMKLKFSEGKNNLILDFFNDFIGGTPRISENIDIRNSELIFVGFGINAPEYQWNDYEGLDVKGKTVLILVNDPGYYVKDSSFFTGIAMTYYGRWIYKYEEAARQGAAAAIIIHETQAASYPWAVVQNSWSGTRFYLEKNILSQSDLQFTSWITEQSAQKLFQNAGLKYEDYLAKAYQRGFKATKMNQKVSISFKNQIEYVKSKNVVAILPGQKRADEFIIYTAHWDHFGVIRTFKGDSILNGALDNATGTAALIELAEAYKQLPRVSDRSVLFLAVTCEEQGLLGSQYYAENPVIPLNKTIAVINMDALNIFGRTRDMTISGMGLSDLDSYAVEVLDRYNRYPSPDSNPESGGYFRSDHFSFSKVGVPSLNISFGIDNVEHGKDWALENMQKWIRENYHKPSDNYDPETWRFDGMVEDLKVYFEIGYFLSVSEKYPNWKDGVMYKTKRDEMMK